MCVPIWNTPVNRIIAEPTWLACSRVCGDRWGQCLLVQSWFEPKSVLSCVDISSKLLSLRSGRDLLPSMSIAVHEQLQTSADWRMERATKPMANDCHWLCFSFTTDSFQFSKGISLWSISNLMFLFEKFGYLCPRYFLPVCCSSNFAEATHWLMWHPTLRC